MVLTQTKVNFISLTGMHEQNINDQFYLFSLRVGCRKLWKVDNYIVHINLWFKERRLSYFLSGTLFCEHLCLYHQITTKFKWIWIRYLPNLSEFFIWPTWVHINQHTQIRYNEFSICHLYYELEREFFYARLLSKVVSAHALSTSFLEKNFISPSLL